MTLWDILTHHHVSITFTTSFNVSLGLTPFPLSADVITERFLWSVAHGEFSFPVPLACFHSLSPSSILHPPHSHILLAIKPTPEYVRSLGPSASFVLLAPSVTKKSHMLFGWATGWGHMNEARNEREEHCIVTVELKWEQKRGLVEVN